MTCFYALGKDRCLPTFLVARLRTPCLRSIGQYVWLERTRHSGSRYGPQLYLIHQGTCLTPQIVASGINDRNAKPNGRCNGFGPCQLLGNINLGISRASISLPGSNLFCYSTPLSLIRPSHLVHRPCVRSAYRTAARYSIPESVCRA